MAVQNVSVGSPREKIMKKDDKSFKEVCLVAQELKLARVLAGNNKISRDRALQSLKKWFSYRSKTLPFTDIDFQRIWKGLYFSMWMSDKPLVQEECAENIANLIHFQTIDESLLFFKAGLTILINEWFGIDQLRVDKFLMLVRRLLRQMLVALKKHGLSKKNISKFGEIISFTILNTDIRPPMGLFMHFTEIYLEEIAKVTKGNIHSERLVDFIQPFIKKLATTSDRREIEHIKKFIFKYLIQQSKLGIEYQVKYDAWKKAGFPGSIHSMQKIKVKNNEIGTLEEEDDSKNKIKEKPLDPRAGRVNVDLPQIHFKAKDILNALQEYKFDKNSSVKSRKAIKELNEHFTKLSKGVYSLGIKKLATADNRINIRKAAKSLIKFENKVMGKEKKKRKKSRENTEEAEVPQKRKKIDISEQNDVDIEVSEDRSEVVTEEELEKFIAQSEGNMRESIKKKKKNVDKQNKNNKIDNVEEAKSFIDSEKKLNRKRKSEPNRDKKEAKRKRKIDKNIREMIIDNIECVFERNSGTWVVYDISGDKEETEVPSQKIETTTDEFTISPSISSNNPENLESVAEPNKSPSIRGAAFGSLNGEESPTKGKVSPQKNPFMEEGSPKSGLSPVRLFESPQTNSEIFPKSAWEEPLQEGEYEICIPAKKHIAKLKKRAKKSNQTVHELINTTMKQIRGKNRLSLDTSLVNNPYSTPSSATKKVKINTKLNMSQEIHEHVQHILSSPAIPYDANKKPLKPLLKTPVSLTPVNPFYSKQLNVW